MSSLGGLRFSLRTESKFIMIVYLCYAFGICCERPGKLKCLTSMHNPLWQSQMFFFFFFGKGQMNLIPSFFATQANIPVLQMLAKTNDRSH